MGITSPVRRASKENSNSIHLTRYLTQKIVEQDDHSEIDQNMIAEDKKRISRDRQQAQKNTLDRLKTNLRKVLLHKKRVPPTG